MIKQSLLELPVRFELPAKIIATIFATMVISHIIDGILRRYLEKMTEKLGIDHTQYSVFRRLTVSGMQVFGLLYALSMVPGFSALGGSLLASAGIIAVIIGYASKEVVSNLISGISLAMFEPFRVGDRVQIGDDFGYVEDITLRSTIIRTWTNKRFVIPNSKISSDIIINYSLKDEKKLGVLDIGIGYSADIDKARAIMIKVANEHPDLFREIDESGNPLIKRDELVKVRLVELNGYEQKLRMYFWAPNHLVSILMSYDMLEAIKKRFDAEGIEVPHPYMTFVKK